MTGTTPRRCYGRGHTVAVAPETRDPTIETLIHSSDSRNRKMPDHPLGTSTLSRDTL